MPELFARPLGPDGEPTRDQWERLGKIVMQPNPYLPGPATPSRSSRTLSEVIWGDLPGLRPAPFMTEHSFTIAWEDRARVMSLFHGGPTWMWTAWLDGRGPAPISRGTAWRDGAYAACQHQLTGPPELITQSYRFARRFPSLPPLPRWYIDLMLQQMRDLDRDLFDARAWYTEPIPPHSHPPRPKRPPTPLTPPRLTLIHDRDGTTGHRQNRKLTRMNQPFTPPEHRAYQAPNGDLIIWLNPGPADTVPWMRVHDGDVEFLHDHEVNRTELTPLVPAPRDYP